MMAGHGHSFRRRLNDQDALMENRTRRIRRAHRVITLIAAMVLLTAFACGGWLLMHPEQIGTFAGRVAAGFAMVRR